MQRGKITILIILLVAVVAAVSSVLYQIRGQQRAQDFWGTQTALLIDKAPQVEVLELGKPAAGLSLGENDEPEDEPPRRPRANRTTRRRCQRPRRSSSTARPG